MKPYLIALLLPLFASCASSPPSSDQMASQVTTLVNLSVKEGSEQKAFEGLAALGPAAVPYIVSHLGDARSLPDHAISLSNDSPDAFEGLRHYAPATVHDALSAILNQLTGQNFEFIYNGATASQRESNMTLPPDFVPHNRSHGQACFACRVCQRCSNCIGLT